MHEFELPWCKHIELHTQRCINCPLPPDFIQKNLHIKYLRQTGASEYVDVMEHIPVRSMKTLDPRVSLANTRKLCGPCNCCQGNSGKSCYATKCCYSVTCNGEGPTGGCIETILACNCNNCV